MPLVTEGQWQIPFWDFGWTCHLLLTGISSYRPCMCGHSIGDEASHWFLEKEHFPKFANSSKQVRTVRKAAECPCLKFNLLFKQLTVFKYTMNDSEWFDSLKLNG